jgi:hypothetical protein
VSIAVALALGGAAPSPAAGQPYLALEYGHAFGTKEAVDGFSDTRFQPGPIGGVHLGLRERSHPFSSWQLSALRYEKRLTESGVEFGRLAVTSVLLGFGAHARRPGLGLGYHATIAVGVNVSSFEEGTFVRDLEQQYGADVKVEADWGFLLTLGGGLDLYLTEWACITSEVRLLLDKIGTTWTVGEGPNEVTIDEIDTFSMSHFQVTVGLLFWLGGMPKPAPRAGIQPSPAPPPVLP